MNSFETAAAKCFAESFGRAPALTLFAPGRVNLIGEHIDYNGGFVLPCSLSIGTYAAAAPTEDGLIRLASADMDDGPFETTADELMRMPHSPEAFRRFSWAAYPLGVAAKLMAAGYAVGGFELALCGSLPKGSGLSSSASLEVLTCAVLDKLFSLRLNGTEAARLSLAAERDCAGVNCGIMDQFICAVGREASAVLLDTHTLGYHYFPFALGENTLLIMNTKKPRRLAESKYNERRAECERALELLNAVMPEPAPNLCSLTPEAFAQYSSSLPPTLLKRARHAVTENARTLRAAEVLKQGDIEEFGRLLNASHASLRDDYEVTGRELDSIVSAALSQPGVLGARMTGAGFGGCAIAVAPQEGLHECIESITRIYKAETGYDCEIYAAVTADAPFGKE